jgi:hypothetical protein
MHRLQPNMLILYISFFYIICTKGNSLQISATLLEMITFAISYILKTQSADRIDMIIGLYNC